MTERVMLQFLSICVKSSKDSICRNRPLYKVMFKPIFLAIQPAVKLVTIPKNSYNKNKYANCNGVNPRV